MRPVRLLMALVFLSLLPLGAFSQPGDNEVTATAEEQTPSVPVTAAIVPIEGDIDRFQVVFLRRSIEKAQKTGVDYIIFPINTFGGRVDSALQIATLIGSLEDIKTIAFIPAEPESVGVSWSAGALISFASSRIYMAPGTSIGAAAPVYQTSEGMQSAGEKTVSAVRTQLAALAEKNGYPPEVAIAMVDQDVELIAVQEPDRYRFELREPSGEDGEEGPASAGGENVEIISPSGKLLTLTSGQMEKYGISSGTFSDIETLEKELGIDAASVEQIYPTSTDVIVNFITSAAVASILLTIGLLALYMEISSPGFGIPGTVALIVFSLMFASSGLMGTLNSAELLLFLAGLVLLIVEVFLIPGFGVAGITGLIFMTVGLVLSRQSFFLPDTDWQWELFLRNLMMVIGTLAASFILMAVLMIFFPRIRLFQRLILTTAGTPAYTPLRSREPAVPQVELQLENQLIGMEGVCLTKLRPAGKIRIGDDIYSVVTDGRWVQPGEKVRVTAVEGNRIVVEEIPS
jgi:membrane-bound serine protease (ClpP class)